MKKLSTYIIISLLAVAVLALMGGAYLLGRHQAADEVEALAGRVDSLRAGEKNAVVVQRVSQQMEDIAYQQMEVANLNRDQALLQQQKATENAARAERESAAAHQSRNEAIAALNEAEKQRARAVEQEKIAVEQRDEATSAKNIADTLNYRTQARTIAGQSPIERQAGRVEESELLAYISWYFLKNYRGNTYFSQTFRALETATNSMKTHVTAHRGAVNALSKVHGETGKCVAATNMGELEMFELNSNRSVKLLFNSRYDFRDVYAAKDAVYALSVNGPLCVVDYSGRVKEVALDNESYFKLLKTDDHSFLIAGRESLRWYDLATGKVSAPVKLPGKLSAIVKRGDVVCLFYKDGKYGEVDKLGRVAEKSPITSHKVIAASYDPTYQCLSIGVPDGTTYILNKYNRICEVLSAHKAQVTNIVTDGTYQLSTSYDKAMYLWKLDHLYFATGLTFAQEMNARTATTMSAANERKNKVEMEWISPVEYKFTSWTTSVCTDMDSKSAWIGTANGEVASIYLEVDDMAKQLHSKLKRNLTNAEWSRYIGTSIPYMKIK